MLDGADFEIATGPAPDARYWEAMAAELSDPLTLREHDVVRLIADGLTTAEIAARLVLSTKTVERHRTNILAKLSLRNRVELTRYAIRRGLVEP